MRQFSDDGMAGQKQERELTDYANQNYKIWQDSYDYWGKVIWSERKVSCNNASYSIANEYSKLALYEISGRLLLPGASRTALT